MTHDNPVMQDKLQEILGQQHDIVLHSAVPFEFGWDAGGRSDVYLYKKHVEGIVYITGDLFGQEQKESDAGNYELMICHREDSEWGPNLIANLAYYTLEASLNSGETMDLGGNFRTPDNKISALIFDRYADFLVDGKRYGLLLTMGITHDELKWANKNGRDALIQKLREQNVYPFTDMHRKSVVKKRSWF